MLGLRVEGLKELRHKCGCRFEEFSHDPDDPRKGRLLDECPYHAAIRERAERAEYWKNEFLKFQRRAIEAEARLAAAEKLAEAAAGAKRNLAVCCLNPKKYLHAKNWPSITNLADVKDISEAYGLLLDGLRAFYPPNFTPGAIKTAKSFVP